MVGQGVAQSGNDQIGLGGLGGAFGIAEQLAADAAFPVFLGAVLGAGGLHSLMVGQLMARSRDGHVGDLGGAGLVGEVLAAAAAGIVGHVTGLGAGCGLGFVEGHLVAQSGKGQGFQSGLGGGSLVSEQLAADIAAPVFLHAGGGAGSGHGLMMGQGMAVGAGVGGAGDQLHIVDGERCIGVIVHGAALQPEGELDVCSPVGLGGLDLRSTLEVHSAHILQIRCVPENGPGIAAVGGGLEGEVSVLVQDGVAVQQVIEGHGGALAGQVHSRGDQQLVLLGSVGHGLSVAVSAVGAPVAPGIIVVIQVHTGLLGGIQVRLGPLIPGVELGAGVGGLDGPAVAGEGVAFEVVVELGSGLGELGFDGVVGGHIGEGVAFHLANACAVHGHVADLITGGSGDGEGRTLALGHGHGAVGGNDAALRSGGRDGELLGGPVEGGRNGVVLGHSLEGIGADLAHALAVHGHVRNGVTLVGGDGEGLVQTVLHEHGAVRGDGAALPGAGGDGMLGAAGSGGDELHIVNGHGTCVLGIANIMESDLDVLGGILHGNFNGGRAVQSIAADAVVGAVHIPQGGPGAAAVCGNFHGNGVVLVTDAADTVAVVEGQGPGLAAAQVNRRGDEPFVLLAALPVALDIGVVGGVAQVLPVVVHAFGPDVVRIGLGALDRPAVAGEGVGLEIVLELGLVGSRNFGEGCRHEVALIHGQGVGVVGDGHAPAVDLHAGERMAHVGGKGQGHAGSRSVGGGPGRGHGAACAGRGGQGHIGGSRSTGGGQLHVVQSDLTGTVSHSLVIVESDLDVGSLELLRNGQFHGAGLVIAGLSRFVLGIPDHAPGLAAVGGGLGGVGHLAVVQGAGGKAVDEVQGSILAGEIDHRGNEPFVLLGAAAVRVLIVLVRVHRSLLVGLVGSRGDISDLGLMPVVIASIAVGLFHRPALAQQALIEVVGEDGLLTGGRSGLEGSGDGVVLAHPLEGVAGQGAHIGAIHHHVLHLITGGGGNGKGLAGALLHQGLAGGADGAVVACGGGDGHIVLPHIGVQGHVVNGQVGTALATVHEGKAQILGILELGRDGHFRLGGDPIGEQARIIPQVPDLLPGLAAVGGGHDQQVVVLVLCGEPVVGDEVKDHVNIGVHAGNIGGPGDQPLVLPVVVIIVHTGSVVFIPIPGVHGIALGLLAPIGRQPGIVEVLGPEDVGGLDGGVIVGVAGHSDGVGPGVAGVVMDDEAEALAHTGHVRFLHMGGLAGLGFTDAVAAVEQAGIAQVVEDVSGHILVVADIKAQVIPALILRDLQILGLGLLGVHGDGELPGGFQVVGGMVRIGQGSLDLHGGLGVVGQAHAVLVGAVPGGDTGALLAADACGGDLIVAVGVDGLTHVLGGQIIVHVAVLAGDGVVQGLGVPQQTGVNAAEVIQEVIAVGGDGIPVGQIGNGEIVVVAQIGVYGVLAGGQVGGIGVGLGLAGGAVQMVPVGVAFHDGGLGPVAVEGQERHAQIDGVGQLLAVGVHLSQGHEAVHIEAVGEGLQGLGRIGERHGDGHVGGGTGGHGHPVIGAVGGEGMVQHHGSLGAGGVGLALGIGVLGGAVGQHPRGDVVVQGGVAGIMHREGHGVLAGHVGIVLQFQLGLGLTGHGQISLGAHGVMNADKACALLPGRNRHAVLAIDDVGGAHQQSIGHVLPVGGAHVRIALLQGLLHDGHSARRMGGSHGGAVHALIGAAGDSRIDAAAGGGDLRLDGQLAGGTPGGEVGHTVNGRGHGAVSPGDGDGLVLQLLQGLAGGLRNEHGGNAPLGNGHIEHTLGVVVAEHTDGTGLGGVLHLLFIVDAAPLDQSDLALHVQPFVVFFVALAGDDHILQLALVGQSPESDGVGGSALDGGAVIVSIILAACGDVGALHHAVVHGSHGHGLAPGRGVAHHAVIRVGGQRLCAEGVAVSGAIGIACSHGQRNAVLAAAPEHLQDVLGELVLAVVVDEAAVGTETHVGHVHAQEDAVLQSRQDIGKGCTAALKEHVHVQDLGLRSHAHHIGIHAGVARCRRGNMGAVVAPGAVCLVQLALAVVKLEGNLGAVIQGLGAEAGNVLLGVQLVLVQDGLEGFLRHGGVGGRILEDGMVHLNAGIQNGDEHPLTVEAGVVVHASADHLIAVGRVGQQLKGGGQEHGLHTVHVLDLLIVAIGDLGGEAVEQGRVLPLRLQGPAAHGLGGNSGSRIALAAEQGIHLRLHAGSGHLIVHHHDDLDLVGIVVLFGGVHLYFVIILVSAAPEHLLGHVGRNVVQRGLHQGALGASVVGSGGKNRAGNCCQQHHYRQKQCTASLECRHFHIPPTCVLARRAYVPFLCYGHYTIHSHSRQEEDFPKIPRGFPSHFGRLHKYFLSLCFSQGRTGRKTGTEPVFFRFSARLD